MLTNQIEVLIWIKLWVTQLGLGDTLRLKVFLCFVADKYKKGG